MRRYRYCLKWGHDEDWADDSFATRDTPNLAAKKMDTRVRVYDTGEVPYRLVVLKLNGQWYWPTGAKCKGCKGDGCIECDNTGVGFDRKVRRG